jgi:hypothetical protein
MIQLSPVRYGRMLPEPYVYVTLLRHLVNAFLAVIEIGFVVIVRSSFNSIARNFVILISRLVVPYTHHLSTPGYGGCECSVKSELVACICRIFRSICLFRVLASVLCFVCEAPHSQH